jgi:hypothetical protein
MFMKTTDAGISWNSFNTPDSTSVYSVTFPNQKTGWAVGDNGTILKFSGNPISINNIEGKIPDRIRLYPNYPNPFNQLSIINYQLSIAGNVKIKVFDISGKEICSLVNQYQLPGSYKTTFDGGSLSSGVYFYQLIAGNKIVQTRKMILIK